jgi:hypothetical protein
MRIRTEATDDSFIAITVSEKLQCRSFSVEYARLTIVTLCAMKAARSRSKAVVLACDDALLSKERCNDETSWLPSRLGCFRLSLSLTFYGHIHMYKCCGALIYITDNPILQANTVVEHSDAKHRLS